MQPARHNARTYEVRWEGAIRASRLSVATKREYTRYNLKFTNWLIKTGVKYETLVTADVQNFVRRKSEKGKGTKVTVAALKFRFREDPTKDIDFTGLAVKTTNNKPHRDWPISTINDITTTGDGRLKGDLPLMCRLLYELAGRRQDLTVLTYACFGPIVSEEEGATVRWFCMKT